MGKRMTISLSPALDNAVENIINKGKYNVNTKVDVLRNGIIVYELIINELEKGNKLCIASQDNKIIKEIIMGV